MGGSMRLRNKKTGEIMEFDAILPVKDVSGDSVAHLEYDSLAELNAEWEDTPEEKHYFISNNGQIHEEGGHDKYRKERQEMGNDFPTEEEAEKAVEKLKAWKRLKDKGFRFNNFNKLDGLVYGRDVAEYNIKAAIDDEPYEVEADIELLFGGEE